MSVRKLRKIDEKEKGELCVICPELSFNTCLFRDITYQRFQKWTLEQWEKWWWEKIRGDDIKKSFEKLDKGRGSKTKRRVFEEVVKPEIVKIQETIRNGGPLKVLLGDYSCILYKDALYNFDRWSYASEEMILQIFDFEDKERRKFERLKRKFELSEQVEKTPKRETIPEEVRIAAWRRDEGKCSNCGSRKNLEYDHIIPVSRGGSNTVRNIELLCEECNRSKKDKIE